MNVFNEQFLVKTKEKNKNQYKTKRNKRAANKILIIKTNKINHFDSEPMAKIIICI